ncbi:hypothetical protein COB11_01540 [Candidatus Aerophobetes bacterium]|uniref:GYF domain-containing protein n=1 Tax=Aerophobetes bacterium TaxID=2030807 RepID=A0A2A4YLE8_UNCAE|nr:MAG: hypothetical protein COB11_01540 [Candidatus Aerophobetes bacterium]
MPLSRFLLLIGLSVLMGLVTAFFARNRRNRDFSIWFILGFMFGLLAFVPLLFLPKLKKKKKENASKEEPIITVDLTPKLPMREQLWYFLDEKQTQVGPVSFEGLRKHFLTGTVGTTSYVWNAMMKDWEPLQALPEYLNEITSEDLNVST